jgi:hypothetical protein
MLTESKLDELAPCDRVAIDNVIAPVLDANGVKRDFSTEYLDDTTLILRGAITIGVRNDMAMSRVPPTEFTFRERGGELIELAEIGNGWFAEVRDGDWLIIDLESFARLPRRSRARRGDMMRFDVRDFSVGILIAASESVLANLSP